jgi:hypothetical protein
MPSKFVLHYRWFFHPETTLRPGSGGCELTPSNDYRLIGRAPIYRYRVGALQAGLLAVWQTACWFHRWLIACNDLPPSADELITCLLVTLEHAIERGVPPDAAVITLPLLTTAGCNVSFDRQPAPPVAPQPHLRYSRKSRSGIDLFPKRLL